MMDEDEEEDLFALIEAQNKRKEKEENSIKKEEKEEKLPYKKNKNGKSVSPDGYELVFRKAAYIQTIIGAISFLINEKCRFIIGKDGLKMSEMDDSHVSFVEFSVKPEWFLSFRHLKKETTIGLSIKHIKATLAKIPSSCVLTMKNATREDLKKWSLSKQIETGASNLYHLSYQDQYGSNVVHSLPLLEIDADTCYPSFPEGEINTLRIGCKRMKDIITRLRISDPEDKKAAEDSILNIIFTKDHVTFACEYDRRIHSMFHVYIPEQISEENKKRASIISQIETRKEICKKNKSKEFVVSEEEKMILQCPKLEVDHSIRIETQSKKYVSVRLSMKYVTRTLCKAPNLAPVVFIDVHKEGLTRIRYHLAKEEDINSIVTFTEDVETIDNEKEEKVEFNISPNISNSQYDILDKEFGGIICFWLAPKIEEEEEEEKETSSNSISNKKRYKDSEEYLAYVNEFGEDSDVENEKDSKKRRIKEEKE